MISNIKALLEFIKILVEVFRYIDDQIDESTFNRKINARKNLRKEYLEAEKIKRLKILKELQK